MDSYLGSVFAFGFNYAPPNWLPCDGRMLSVSQFTNLFALLGTTYGGDGVNNFGIPNLQGAIPIGMGQGATLSNYALAQTGGAAEITLVVANVPTHTHTATAIVNVGNAATTGNPSGAYYGDTTGGLSNTYSTTTNVKMAVDNATSALAGGSGAPSPVEILPPYQVLNYCICTNGVWPVNPN